MRSRQIRILILFAHPRYEESRVSRALREGAERLACVELHDLYEVYPTYHIDSAAEQKRLLEADIVIWQHPFYWYSCPALLRLWMELVLSYGWAYGPEGDSLKGKRFTQCVSVGDSLEEYTEHGEHGRALDDYLAGFRQTAHRCGGKWLDPYVVYGSDALFEPHDLRALSNSYRVHLESLMNGEPSQ